MPFDTKVIEDLATKYGYQAVPNANQYIVSYQKNGTKLLIYFTSDKNTVAIIPPKRKRKSGNGQRCVKHVTHRQLDDIFRNPLTQYENHKKHITQGSKRNTPRRARLSFRNTDIDITNHVNDSVKKSSRKRTYAQFNPTDTTARVPTKRIKYTTSSNHKDHTNQDANDTWECSVCTYLNTMHLNQCEICKTIRNDAHNQDKPPQWTCTQCTYSNSNDAVKCTVCGKTKLMDDEWECASCTLYNKISANRCVMCNASQTKDPKHSIQSKKKQFEKQVTLKQISVNMDHENVEEIQQFEDDSFPLKARGMTQSVSKPKTVVDEEQKEQIPCDHVIDYEVFKGNTEKEHYCAVLEKQVRAHQEHEYKEYKRHLMKMNSDLSKTNADMNAIFPYQLIKYDHTPATRQVVTFESMEPVQKNNNYKSRKYNNYNANQCLKYGMDVLLFCSCALKHDVLGSNSDKFYESLLRNGRILDGKVVDKDEQTVVIRIKTYCKEIHEYSDDSAADRTTEAYHDPRTCRFIINEDKFRFITIQIQLRGIETFLQHADGAWFQYFYRLIQMPIISNTNDENKPHLSPTHPSCTMDAVQKDTQITSPLNRIESLNKDIMDKYKELNPSQMSAISNGVVYPCSLVQGPPGTGKTYTACHIIDYLLSQDTNGRILMTAHTHCAVDQFLDELMTYFAKYKHGVVRMGAISKVGTKSQPFCLDNKIKEYATEYEEMQDLFQRARIAENPNERGELRQQAMAIKDALCRRALQQSSIILGTCYGCCNKYLMDLNKVRTNSDETDDKQNMNGNMNGNLNDTVRIDCVLFDESTQIHEPEMLAVANCLFPYGKQKRIVMIGDPQQLSPITKSEESKTYGYNCSIFERLLYKLHVTNLVATLRMKSYSKDVNGLPNFVMLNVQYRGYDVIHEWSNQMFYHGKLVHDKRFNGSNQLLPGYEWKNEMPINFVHIESQQEAKSSSWINRKECKAVVDIAMNVMAYHHRNKHLIQGEGVIITDVSQIGIITPHKPQQQLIRDELIKRCGYEIAKNLHVSTVDAFQGQQKKLILYSLTRTDRKRTSFTANAKRVNVAFTRSKFGLLVVGNVNQLRINVDFWLHFKNYLQHLKVIDVTP